MKKYIPILYTAGISFALFSLLLFLRGFYPFGNGSVMLTDMYDECVPSLYRFYDIINGHKNIFYEFQASGGLNLYTETINEIVNPFNYILLFWRRENIYLAVNVLLMLYVVFAACSAHFFLIKIWDKPSKLDCLLSLCYAFSGYFAYNFQILRWMIIPVIFPVFLLACIKLWEEQKGTLYSILLAYQIVLSVQHGYMTLLLSLFTSGIWMYCVETKNQRKRLCFSVGIHPLVGLGLSAAVLLPTISTLTSSSRSGANASYFAVFEQHGLQDLFERLFQFCHPVLLGLLLVMLYQLIKNSRFKAFLEDSKTKFFVILNIFLVITILLQPANLLWHMGSYVCFPVRYGYMLVFAIVCLIKSIEEDYKNINEKSDNNYFRELIKVVIAAGMAACAIILLKSNETEIVRGFWTLAISKSYMRETLMVVVILLLLFGASVLSVGKSRVSRIALFVIVGVCSFCYFNMISLPESFRDTQESAYQKMVAEYQNPEEIEFLNLIAREKHNPDYPRNASLINGKSSLSGYFPTAEAIYQYTIGDLGYLTPWVSTIDVGGTKISDYFFDHALFLSKEQASFELEERMPLENQKKLLNAMFSAESEIQDDVFEILYGETFTLSDSGMFTIDIREKSTLYVDAVDLYRDLEIYVNDKEINLPMENMQDDPHAVLCLGTFDEGQVRIVIYDKQEEVYPIKNIKIGVLNEYKWEKLVEKKDFDTDKFKVTSEGFVCKFTVTDNFQNGVLVLPFNATEGWEVYVDGEEKSIQQIGWSFVGLELCEGHHDIEFEFFPPHFRIGCIISSSALIALIAFCFVRKFAGNLEVVAEILFTVVFWGAILAVYVIPAMGLILHLSRRIISMIL